MHQTCDQYIMPAKVYPVNVQSLEHHFKHKMILIWFFLCREVKRVFLSSDHVFTILLCPFLGLLGSVSAAPPTSITDHGLPCNLVKFASRQHHTYHTCPKLAAQHFHKVWENKRWTSTLLIAASLLSQLALELAQSLLLRAGMHPSSSLVRLLDSRTRCAKCFQKEEHFTLQWSWFFEMCSNLHTTSLLKVIIQ